MKTSIIPIILAAGKGGRFGDENKLLHVLNGKPILQHSIEVFLNVLNIVVVVIGNNKDTLITFLKSIDEKRITPIYNNTWKEGGMSSSVKKGVKYVKENFSSQGILIHPGDIPYITKNDIELIIKKAKEEHYKKIIIPQYQQKNGHPMFIPQNLFSEVFEITESSEGLRGFLKQNENNKIFVTCNKGILNDIDTKEDIK